MTIFSSIFEDRTQIPQFPFCKILFVLIHILNVNLKCSNNLSVPYLNSSQGISPDPGDLLFFNVSHIFSFPVCFTLNSLLTSSSLQFYFVQCERLFSNNSFSLFCFLKFLCTNIFVTSFFSQYLSLFLGPINMVHLAYLFRNIQELGKRLDIYQQVL